MKIAFTFLTFGKDIFAGMENALFNLASGINRVGGEAVVFTSTSYGDSPELGGIKVFRSKYLPTNFGGGDESLEKRLTSRKEEIVDELHEFIDKENPDVIVVWDPLWGFLQVVGTEDIIKPIALVMHVVDNERILRGANEFLYRKVFAVSDSLIEDLKRSDFDYTDIDILPNSIDTGAFVDAGKKSKKKKVVLCNARISPEKGIEYAIRGFADFTKDNPDYELHLCSGGFPFGNVNEFGNVDEARRRAKNLVADLKLENKVIFLPNLKWDEIPNIVAEAEIFLTPTLAETFGIAVLESMACGTPVVASGVGNIPSLLSGGRGVLVKPKSPREITEGLSSLVGNGDLRREIVSKAQVYAMRYDNRKVAIEFIDKLGKL